MTGGQVVALGCAIALLLPGACFLAVGVAGSDRDGLVIALFILAAAGGLFWAAFAGKRSRRAPRPPGNPPQ